MEICVLPTLTSTNAYVREKADYGELEGYTVISNEQTAGRGRLWHFLIHELRMFVSWVAAYV